MKICVTGGSGGMGEAIVRRLVKDGHTVLFTYRSLGRRAESVLLFAIKKKKRLMPLGSYKRCVCVL